MAAHQVPRAFCLQRSFDEALGFFCRSILRLVGRLDAPDSDLPPLLLGRGHVVGSEQITDTGDLLQTSNPRLKQFVRDVVLQCNTIIWMQTCLWIHVLGCSMHAMQPPSSKDYLLTAAL